MYIHITNEIELLQVMPWITEEKTVKDFFIYISASVKISDEEKKVLGAPN